MLGNDELSILLLLVLIKILLRQLKRKGNIILYLCHKQKPYYILHIHSYKRWLNFSKEKKELVNHKSYLTKLVLVNSETTSSMLISYHNHIPNDYSE